ncbi:SDR family NAD(P)-dependent oxidoreductase [Peterkaempfera bronchialis]|uniref:SDR family NAD(P)-dependent oxidoreductase n=1 Tax=Peterkaempfera bronchialis TaxID=2126346 RepID=A0A345SU83_9ACTN|nr:SDR family NAD(P)-dependent oxidoreductase [Peterkaempfera bronchialis]AXI77288.1 SDR family NAD(P)-dependent oxidoreductase [Peterkaempfera bronchialis]
MDIHGNVALVTGGTSGLGLASARRLVASGARVVFMGRRSDRAEKVTADLGSHAVFVPGDVTRTEDVAAAVDAARSLGRLGALISCAGIAVPGRTLGRRGPLPLEDFERVVRVNLLGTFNVVRLAAEAMAANQPVDGDRGVVVCTSSIAAYEGQEGQTAYTAAKAAIAGMTLPLARDLARHAIRVVTIAPGLFDTPMVAGLSHEARDSLARQTPHPVRLGRTEEFASLVAHIIDNPMLNGEVIRLDGAVRLGPI